MVLNGVKVAGMIWCIISMCRATYTALKPSNIACDSNKCCACGSVIEIALVSLILPFHASLYPFVHAVES